MRELYCVMWRRWPRYTALLAKYRIDCIYLNIICREDSSPSIEFSINPVLVNLSSHIDDVTFSEGQLPGKLDGSFIRCS